MNLTSAFQVDTGKFTVLSKFEIRDMNLSHVYVMRFRPASAGNSNFIYDWQFEFLRK